MERKSHLRDLFIFQHDGNEPRLGYIAKLKSFLLDFGDTVADPRWSDGDPQDARAVIANIRRARHPLLDDAAAQSAIGLCEKLKDWAVSLQGCGKSGYDPWWLYYTTNFIVEVEQAANAGRDTMCVLLTCFNPPPRRLISQEGSEEEGQLWRFKSVSRIVSLGSH